MNKPIVPCEKCRFAVNHYSALFTTYPYQLCIILSLFVLPLE